MKTQLIQTAVAALTLAAAGYAQSAQELKVTVPFGFVAGSRTLPAGQYTVSQPANTSAVVIRSADGAGVVMVTNQIESPGRQEIAKLVFHRYGDHYFLAEVWDTDRSTGSQLPKTPQERERARHSREHLATIFAAAR